MKCPSCQGKGEVFGHLNTRNPKTHGFQWVQCFRCRGACEVDDSMADDIREGEALRERRVAAGWTLGGMAREFGVPASDVSSWERGYKPVPEHVRKAVFS